MQKERVLFICVHNSARSQMAEAWLNHLCSDLYEGHSAGWEPGALNPLAVQVMKEVDIDISHHRTKSVFDMVKSGKTFSYVITVCDETSAERCPVFMGVTRRLHWSFPDPAAVTGTFEQKLTKVRAIRDSIKEAVERWSKERRKKIGGYT